MSIPQLNKRKHCHFYSRVHSVPANQWRAMLYPLLSQSIALSFLPKHINCQHALRSFAFLSIRLRRTIRLELFNHKQRELLPSHWQTQFDKQSHSAWSQKLQKTMGLNLLKCSMFHKNWKRQLKSKFFKQWEPKTRNFKCHKETVWTIVFTKSAFRPKQSKRNKDSGVDLEEQQ